MRGFVRSSPYFFRMIKRAMAIFGGALLVLALLMPAPLQAPADISRVPNPVKSAWFLLWVQELVSHSNLLVYAVALLALFFLALPWLPPGRAAKNAEWFPRDQVWVNVMTLAVFGVIIALTVAAMFFRGANWQFIAPF